MTLLRSPFLRPRLDMKSFDLAALDTLPQRLSRNSQQTHRLMHCVEVIWCFFSDRPISHRLEQAEIAVRDRC